jgi:hypothetical protein
MRAAAVYRRLDAMIHERYSHLLKDYDMEPRRRGKKTANMKRYMKSYMRSYMAKLRTEERKTFKKEGV